MFTIHEFYTPKKLNHQREMLVLNLTFRNYVITH